MFGELPIEGPTNIFCDDEVVTYHRCREVVAAGTARVAKEGTMTNLYHLLTTLLPQTRRDKLLDKFTC